MRGPGPANFLHSFGVLVLIFIRDESCQFCDLPDVADLSHATIDISNLLPQGPHPWEKGNSVVFARSIVVDINVLSFFPLRCCAHTSINLSIHPFIHPASQPSIHPSVHPSIRPSVHQVKKKPKQIQKQTNEKVDMT